MKAGRLLRRSPDYFRLRVHLDVDDLAAPRAFIGGVGAEDAHAVAGFSATGRAWDQYWEIDRIGQ